MQTCRAYVACNERRHEATYWVSSANLPQPRKSGSLSTSKSCLLCTDRPFYGCPLLLLHMQIWTSVQQPISTCRHILKQDLGGLNENPWFLISNRITFNRASLTILSPDHVSPQRDKFKGVDDCFQNMWFRKLLVFCFLIVWFLFVCFFSSPIHPSLQLHVRIDTKLFGKKLDYTTITSQKDIVWLVSLLPSPASCDPIKLSLLLSWPTLF